MKKRGGWAERPSSFCLADHFPIISHKFPGMGRFIARIFPRGMEGAAGQKGCGDLQAEQSPTPTIPTIGIFIKIA